jgi:hypothetical protein
MLFRKAQAGGLLGDIASVPAESRPGTLKCSGIGCSNHTGLTCAYVDRRGRHCKTAWCPAHRQVYGDEVYCALHASTMAGIDSEYGQSVHPDLENRLPAIVNWVTRNAEDDIVATMASIARGRNEVLVSDPVRMVLHTVGRIKTWERSWKSCSTLGVTCRVSISIEEKNPDELEVRVNSRVVARVPTPWDLAAGSGRPDLDAKVFRQIVMPVSFALDQWQQGFLPDQHEPDRPATAEAALDLIAGIMADELGLGDFAGDEDDYDAAAPAPAESAATPAAPQTFVGALSALAALGEEGEVREITGCEITGSEVARPPRARPSLRNHAARRAIAPYRPRRR